jgi:hypothetical protein
VLRKEERGGDRLEQNSIYNGGEEIIQPYSQESGERRGGDWFRSLIRKGRWHILFLRIKARSGDCHTPILRLGKDKLVQVILEVVGDPCPAVAVVDREESQLRVRLQVGEGCAPVLHSPTAAGQLTHMANNNNMQP